MNPQLGVNLLVLLAGLVIVAVLFFVGSRAVSEQHPARQWATGFFNSYGLGHTARLAGLVVIAVVLGTLTLLYS